MTLKKRKCCYCGFESTDKMFATIYGGGMDKLGRVYNCTGVLNCLSRIRQNRIRLTVKELTELAEKLNKAQMGMDDNNKTPEVSGNSLRDEVKDAIKDKVTSLLSRQLSKEILFDYAVEIAGQAADDIFDLLHIDEDKQDMNYHDYMTT